MPFRIVTVETWRCLVQDLRLATGNGDIDEVNTLLYYGICPDALFTELSHELMEAWVVTGGTKHIKDPQTLYDLPALYVEASGVIERIIAEAKKEQQKCHQ